MTQRSGRIKLLYLMDAVDGVGGTEGQVAELVRHLDRDRFEPHVGFFRSTSHMAPLAALVCSVSDFKVPRLLHPVAPLKLLALAAAVRAERFELVHLFMNAASLAAPFFCRLGGAAVVGSRRDMGFWYTPRQLALLRVSNRGVSRIIANSDAVRRNVHQREGYPLSMIEVVYNGHDPARFEVAPLPGFRERLKIAAADPIVGMVANFNPWKRHIDLLRAFALVRRHHPRAHLVLAGRGDDELNARAAVRSLGLDAAVHFLGGVAEVVPVVQHLSIGVLCSESEGFSNSVVEYMGCGKPVVCTNVGGNAELVKEGDSGFLVNPGDVNALADRMTRLLASPALAAAMGQRAREAVEGLTSQRMAELHMDLYERVAHSKPMPAMRRVVRSS